MEILKVDNPTSSSAFINTHPLSQTESAATFEAKTSSSASMRKFKSEADVLTLKLRAQLDNELSSTESRYDRLSETATQYSEISPTSSNSSAPEETQPSECIDLQKLEYQLQKEVQEAIRNGEYAKLPPLYDQLLKAWMEARARCYKELGIQPSEIDEITLEALFAEPKSYYLILDGQLDKAIDLWTQIIEKINACEDKSLLRFYEVSLQGCLQMRAAAYLIDGKRELALQDLKEAGRFSYVIDCCGDTIENRIASFHSFEDVQRIVLLRTLEQYLKASLVEVPIATPDQLEQMSDWAKADYYLAHGIPEEALKFVGNSEERRALALAQLGHFDEEFLEASIDYDVLPLIYFMKGDLEKALAAAGDYNSYFMQLLFSYLQKNH